MAELDSDDAFHSADEESKTVDSAPPSSDQEGKSTSQSNPSTASASNTAASKKEPPNTGKCKNSKGKKGKKKQTSVQEDKEAKSEVSKPVSPAVSVETSPEKPTLPKQEETQTETDKEQSKPSEETMSEETKTETVESESRTIDDSKPPAVKETLTESSEQHKVQSANLEEQPDEDQSREDIQSQQDAKHEDAKDTQMKTDTEDLHEENDGSQENEKKLLESGDQIERNVEDVPLSFDGMVKSDETAAGSSSEEAEVSMAGALSRLTGEKPDEKKSSGGWGWGGWGSSLVSSVSKVGHSLSSVIENVETSLGVPKPETLSEQELKEQQFVVKSEGERDKNEEETVDEEKQEDGEMKDQDEDVKQKEGEIPEGQSEAQSSSSVKGFFSFGASAITSVVGKTVTGGLDALETIGRKTMDVLQEGDSEAIRRQGNAGGERGRLSEILRDAKKEAETVALLEEEEKERQRAHFGFLFDQFQGLAHLEALEMISNQSESKVQGSLSTLSGDNLQSLKTELIEIRDAFQLEDLESEDQPEGSEQDFVNAITEHLFGVTIASTPDKLQRVQKAAHDWLAECKTKQEAGQKQEIKELHIKAMEVFAEFTSRVIEQFHKASELMLLPQDKEQGKSSVQRATSLSKLTSVLAAEVSNLANNFGECLNREATNQEDENSEDVNPLITNIYLEASNSTSYIQDAFQLILPVLQMVSIERRQESLLEATS
ncbi:protein FAM114A2-like [Asterias rubens]|uniref:protein FAM114A2-like n=1 Tax=Asterias rubens TaxID=7604 RepID=UPI001455AF58|nr:protein FAM114A2-like [Asterias rubens]XP_033646336.1 protein FAM114A2-like [Asterias rubens]XP_033646337.1 protein FAM114A2-like [Asterias rubens]